ncbi:MAG: type II toxin-antitoxin system VapC family toxin [Longimicrobiaceae bacterium]
MTRLVLDPSALIAYLKAEPEATRLQQAMIAASTLSLSAASLVEAGMVTEKLRGGGSLDLDVLLVQLHVSIVPFTEAQAELARAAFRRFGKGRHPAGLNFGDCFSYALARALGQPLLFVGNDFSQTDVQVAPY